MFGFVIGALAVAGVLAFKRHRRRMYAWHYGQGFGPAFGCGLGLAPWQGGFGRHHHGGGFGHPPYGRAPFQRRARMLYPLFRELDASPGQERVMAELVDKLRGALSGAHGTAEGLRRELATLLDAPALDEAQLADVITRGQGLVNGLGEELKAALATLHGSLDPEQRRVLAQLISRPRY